MNCHIPRGWRFTSLLQCLIILSTRYSITVLGMFGITNGTDRASKDHAMMAQHGANANPDGTLAVDRSQIPSGNHARAQSTTEDAPRAPKEVTSTSSLLEQSRLLEHREQTRLLAQSRFGWDPAQHWRTNTHKPPVVCIFSHMINYAAYDKLCCACVCSTIEYLRIVCVCNTLSLLIYCCIMYQFVNLCVSVWYHNTLSSTIQYLRIHPLDKQSRLL
eukprot:GHVQ01030033.1.p1 GENE.GHVQ01030033.1~~GHVQ01030033.1.p1  ORF type:complete len:217 (-),score=14.98 GHVQ01030033.1:1381-2031(-)